MNNRLDSLLKLLEKEPEDSFLLYGVALEYISANNLEESEKYFIKLINADPDYLATYMQYAGLKEKQDKIDEAKELYKQGIEKAQKSGDNHAAKEMEDFLDELN
ncbi:MAG TPA: hypothetical protein VJ954_04005 [Ignavibacteriaceae bacterium]|nr:hypothetical protein [Ignavibacteriaceae bacterium]